MIRMNTAHLKGERGVGGEKGGGGGGGGRERTRTRKLYFTGIVV